MRLSSSPSAGNAASRLESSATTRQGTVQHSFMHRGHCAEALRSAVLDRDMEAGVSYRCRAFGHMGVQSRMRSGTQNP